MSRLSGRGSCERLQPPLSVLNVVWTSVFQSLNFWMQMLLKYSNLLVVCWKLAHTISLDSSFWNLLGQRSSLLREDQGRSVAWRDGPCFHWFYWQIFNFVFRNSCNETFDENTLKGNLFFFRYLTRLCYSCGAVLFSLCCFKNGKKRRIEGFR